MGKKRLHLEDVYNPDTKVITMPAYYNLVEKGLGTQSFQMMQKHKHEVAQIIAETGEVDTYGSLLKRCVRAALELKTRDLSKDDIVCLCSNNNINSCVPFIASLFLGLTTAALDPSMNVTDVTYLIGQVRPKIFFVIPEMANVIKEALDSLELDAEIVVLGDTEEYTKFDDFLQEKKEENQFEPVETEDLSERAMILFSSGTTGMPKGIVLSQRSLLGGTTNWIHCGQFVKVTLTYATFYWITSVLMLFGAIFTGTARVICSQFDAKQLWELLETYKVTFLFLAPIQASLMLQAGRPDNLDTSELLCVLTGGVNFSQRQLEQLRDLLPGTAISQVYGQTEVSGIISVFMADRVEDNQLLNSKPTSCGRPVPNIAYKVVDVETDQPCGPNKEGELRLKCPFLMTGYYNMDSSNTYDSEGWLRTGDVVYYDEDLCFYIVDRIKEMMKFRSWHVLPTPLEKILSEHPAVVQSVVVGMPHEVDGDHPMAVVRVDPSYPVTPEELEKYVEERVDDRQRLRAGVKIVKAIPSTPTGKIKRNQIRDLVLKGLI